MKLLPSLLSAGLLATCLTGCLMNASPAARTFLPALPEQARADAPKPMGGMILLVSRVELPRYLDRPEIALRKDNVEIVYAAFSHWAQPLDLACTSLLAQALRSSLNNRTVKAYPDVTADGADRLSIRFERFEATSTGTVVAEATWSLISGSDGKIIQTGSFSTRVVADPTDMGNIASAHGKVLAELAGAIGKTFAH